LVGKNNVLTRVLSNRNHKMALDNRYVGSLKVWRGRRGVPTNRRWSLKKKRGVFEAYIRKRMNRGTEHSSVRRLQRQGDSVRRLQAEWPIKEHLV